MVIITYSFYYKRNKILIQSNLEDKMKEICKKFSQKINEDVDSKIYIYEGKLLNLDLPINQQLNLKNKFNEEFIILVNDKPQYNKIKFKYIHEEKKEILFNIKNNLFREILLLIKNSFIKMNNLFKKGLTSKDDLNKIISEKTNNTDKLMSFLFFDNKKIIRDVQDNKDEGIELEDLKDINEKRNNFFDDDDDEYFNDKINYIEKFSKIKHIYEIKKFNIKINTILLI